MRLSILKICHFLNIGDLTFYSLRKRYTLLSFVVIFKLNFTEIFSHKKISLFDTKYFFEYTFGEDIGVALKYCSQNF